MRSKHLLFSKLEDAVKQQWYIRLTWLKLLYPFYLLFLVVIKIRRLFLQTFIVKKAKYPIWIIGDITVGGSGKSPFISWLANYLHSNGLSLVVVGHGYKSNLHNSADICFSNSDPEIFGDEAVMLAGMCDVPIVVGKSRKNALAYISKKFPNIDLIICDDGLQDYSMPRQAEIVILNKTRLGNKLCFPVGPLREPLSRLLSVDIVVNNDSQSDMSLSLCSIINMDTGERTPLSWLKGRVVHAAAGIAHPERFFNALTTQGAKVLRHSFQDHHSFSAADISFNDDMPILVTSKDAVKISKLNINNVYIVTTKLNISPRILAEIDGLVNNLDRASIQT